jgi:opacity protein-like surface antigen
MMKRLFGAVALAAVLAAPASAQLIGNAVYPAFPGTGVRLAGDVGFSLNDDAKVGGESAMYGGARVGLGLPILSAWAGLGTYPMGVDGVNSELSFGGGVGLNLLSAPLMPIKLSLQAGGGYQSVEGNKTINVPVGALLVINVPSPGIGIEPWVYARGHWRNVSPSVGDSNSDFGFGVSGGLNLTLPIGFGIHVVGDWMTIGDPAVKPLVLSVGLDYKISVPSLGM